MFLLLHRTRVAKKHQHSGGWQGHSSTQHGIFFVSPSLTPNHKMEEGLNKVWADFSSVMAERGARLSVALMFYRSAEKVIVTASKVPSTLISC